MSEPRLSIGRIAGYGVGDFGFNLFFTGLNLYLLYYYTDVLGISPATAGLIFMIPVIWDGVTDPLMGWIASRTRTRWGRYRPYILLGAPFMAGSFVLMFAAPIIFPSALVIVSAAAHILFRTAYTVVSIPYTSLSAAMTRDSGERASLAGMRMFAAVFGGLLTAAMTLPLARRFGAGELALGFVWVACLYALIATVILIGVFAATREREIISGSRQDQNLTSLETLQFLRFNTAFWILFVAIFFGAVGSSIAGKALVYFIIYYAGAPEAVSSLLTASLLATGLSIPFWTFLGQRYSKRLIWLGAALCGATCQAFLFLIAPRDVAVLLPFLCVAGVFNGAFVVMFWAMLPDTVEYGEWRSGVRDEAVLFGLNQFALKAASGLGVGALGLSLSAVGYVAAQPQTKEALYGLRTLAFALPFLTGLIAASLIAFYPVSRALHNRLVNGLAFREMRRLR